MADDHSYDDDGDDDDDNNDGDGDDRCSWFGNGPVSTKQMKT